MPGFSPSDFNIVDAGNSSSILLPALATFTGEWTDVRGYSSLSVTCKSDVASIFSGIQIQWSSDGVTNDLPNQNFTYDPNAISEQTFRVHATITAPYFRLVYQNNVTDQTLFNLITLLRKGTPAATIRTLDPTNTFATNIDVATVQGILSGVGRFNREMIQMPLMDDVNIAEFPSPDGPFIFVSPRPGKAENILRKISTATLSSVQLTNSFGERRTFISIMNKVQRGNLYIQLNTDVGLSITSYDYVIPPEHTWQDPGQFGSVFPGDVFGLWDEVYIEDSGLPGTAISVENFYG